jgi:hypothetical protein
MLEAKTVVAMLYRRFRFRPAEDRPEALAFCVTTKPRYGVQLIPVLREDVRSKSG